MEFSVVEPRASEHGDVFTTFNDSGLQHRAGGTGPADLVATRPIISAHYTDTTKHIRRKQQSPDQYWHALQHKVLSSLVPLSFLREESKVLIILVHELQAPPKRGILTHICHKLK